MIGLTTAVCRQSATLMASSFPEDDHRFLTHSIKALMEAVTVAMLRLTYHMIEKQRETGFFMRPLSNIRREQICIVEEYVPHVCLG